MSTHLRKIHLKRPDKLQNGLLFESSLPQMPQIIATLFASLDEQTRHNFDHIMLGGSLVNKLIEHNRWRHGLERYN